MPRPHAQNARWLSALILAGCSSPAATVQDAAPRDVAADAPADAPTVETLHIAGLSAPVEVTTDRYGWPHIKGATLTDVVRVQGYIQARDRLVQMRVSPQRQRHPRGDHRRGVAHHPRW